MVNVYKKNTERSTMLVLGRLTNFPLGHGFKFAVTVIIRRYISQGFLQNSLLKTRPPPFGLSPWQVKDLFVHQFHDVGRFRRDCWVSLFLIPALEGATTGFSRLSRIGRVQKRVYIAQTHPNTQCLVFFLGQKFDGYSLGSYQDI